MGDAIGAVDDQKRQMKPAAKPNANQLEMGHMLEPIAAHFYAKNTGNTVIDDTYMYQHADFPFALADFDRRFIRAADDEPGILECKSCTYHKASGWANGAFPLYYEFQLRFYLSVADVNMVPFLPYGETILIMIWQLLRLFVTRLKKI